MYKLIACDLDETLLDDQKNVPEANRQAIKQVTAQGVKFVPTTGRGFTSVQNTLQEIGLAKQPDEYVISFNGGIITENAENKILSCHGISFDQAKTVFDIGLQHNVYMHIFSLENNYMYNFPTFEKQYLRNRIHDYVEISPETFTSLKNEHFIKVIFGCENFRLLQDIERTLPDEIRSQYAISFSSNRYLEFNQKGVTKGEGITRLAQKLGMTLDNVIAIGDNNNDIPMLRKAGFSAAVQNATDEVKKEVDYVCQATNNQSAVAEVIKKFF
ncbi:Cof-type HAD-IIB family hydrolase [Orbaceae bacterium ESL0727]|nr:Cof-type HAD-IIB family hydrolase [Orbaceae bacterium ESL0727]